VDATYREIINSLFTHTGVSLFLNDFVEENNGVNTIGSMQVAVRFAAQYEAEKHRKELSLEYIWAIRDRLYTREGGLYYGALLLLGYETGYSLKLHRFADFNAGRYASRNAAFQATVAILPGKKLILDGDLLAEKAYGFNRTNTYKTIIGRYKKQKGVNPPYARVPDIALQSEKISKGRKMTTGKFAASVTRRYHRCMNAATG
jgi:hypothetical protein